MKRIGGLWIGKSKKDGKPFLSGQVEFIAGIKTRILVFANDKKDKEGSPDRIVYVGDDDSRKEVKKDEQKVSEVDF